MANLMDGGFVYGIDNVHELTFKSLKNIKKNNEELLNNGRVILNNTTKDVKEGLKEYAPYDCIHVGCTVEKIPRKLIS